MGWCPSAPPFRPSHHTLPPDRSLSPCLRLSHSLNISPSLGMFSERVRNVFAKCSQCFRDVFGYAGIFSITHAQVTACGVEDSVLYAIVRRGELETKISPNSSRWRLTEVLDLWPATKLTQSVAWYTTSDDKWIVLHA